MKIQFYKYQGTGNDFVIIDGRIIEPKLTTEQIHFMCDRRFGIGADGLMLLLPHTKFDFEMKYYNADGKEGSMCGNGGRCIVQFAMDHGIINEKYIFTAPDGLHEAEFDLNGRIRLKMNDVNFVQMIKGDYTLNTGSPHYVKFVKDLEHFSVAEEGKLIRNSELYIKEGINVNFVEPIDEDSIFVRTYERGVENETWSCGTGVTACALVSAHNDRGFNNVYVKTLGGELSVEFERVSDTEFKEIWLCGPAKYVFSGEIEI
ncbi:MAG: diaminopimelate epimerase [Chitinophagaceae bacterium]